MKAAAWILSANVMYIVLTAALVTLSKHEGIEMTDLAFMSIKVSSAFGTLVWLIAAKD